MSNNCKWRQSGTIDFSMHEKILKEALKEKDAEIKRLKDCCANSVCMRKTDAGKIVFGSGDRISKEKTGQGEDE